MAKCKKCLTADCNELFHRLALRSGFFTILCDECRTNWNEAFGASEVFADLVKLDAREDMYKYGAMGGESISFGQWEALHVDGEAANRRAFAFARRWMAAD